MAKIFDPAGRPVRGTPDYQELLKYIMRLEAKVNALAASPRLTNAAIDDDYLSIRDAAGRERIREGKQADGRYSVAYPNSGDQGQPTAPIVTDASDGSVTVSWDGSVVTGAVGSDQSHLEVLKARVTDANPDPQPEQAETAMNRIPGRTEGSTTVATAEPGAYRFWLRAVGLDGVTRGPASPFTEAEVESFVDAEAIEERIAEAEAASAERIAAAEQRLEQVESSAEEWEQRRPEIEADLAEARDLLDAERAAREALGEEVSESFEERDRQLADAEERMERLRDPDVIVDSLLQALEADIERLFFDTAIGREVLAEVARLSRVEANEGIIGGAVLQKGTVSADRFIADELVAEVGRILLGQFENVEVLDHLWAQGAFVEEFQARAADLIVANIRELTVTEGIDAQGGLTIDSIVVTEEFAARFAELLHLVADRIDVNEFIAQSSFIAHLEAIGITLSDEAGGRRFRVSGQGYRLERDMGDGDWSTVASLGVAGEEDQYALTNEDGETTFVATTSGHVAARSLESVEDLHVGGDALLGDLLGWEHPSDLESASRVEGILNQLPRGVVSTGWTSGTGMTLDSHVNNGILEVQHDRIAGRMYQYVLEVFNFRFEAGHAAVTLYATSDGSPPQVPRGSSIFGLSAPSGTTIWRTQYLTSSRDSASISVAGGFSHLRGASTDGVNRVRVGVHSSTGGEIRPYPGSTLIRLNVLDVGLNTHNSGTEGRIAYRNPVSTGGGGGDSGSETPTPPRWVTRTRTFRPTNFRSWASNGNYLGSGGSSTSIPVGSNMVQGPPPYSPFGYVRSAAFFGSNWGIPASARMISASVRIRWSHTYLGSGASARFTRHGAATRGTTRPSSPALGTAHASRGGVAVYNLSSTERNMMRGNSPTIRGFGLGDGNGGQNAYAYGREMEVRVRYEEQV